MTYSANILGRNYVYCLAALTFPITLYARKCLAYKSPLLGGMDVRLIEYDYVLIKELLGSRRHPSF
jgi:hypothetical protein